jgi:DNA modification methylase
MSQLNGFVGEVFAMNALRLLRALPTASIDACISDPMYGVKKGLRYASCCDPGEGDPDRHWAYHKPIYEECLRVLRPGGVLAWAQGGKFFRHFGKWFGGHRVWTLTRFADTALIAVGNVWIVQTRERQAIEFPTKDSLVICNRSEMLKLKKYHPCPKPVEEIEFLIETITKPGQVVLDCFCGLGSTLIAAEQLGRRWIGCDLSRRYCQIGMKRMAEVRRTEVAQHRDEEQFLAPPLPAAQILRQR